MCIGETFCGKDSDEVFAYATPATDNNNIIIVIIYIFYLSITMYLYQVLLIYIYIYILYYMLYGVICSLNYITVIVQHQHSIGFPTF